MDVSVQLLVAAISGGVVIKLIELFANWAGIISGDEKRFRDDIVSRLHDMQERIDTLEDELRNEAWSRLKAEAMLMRLLSSHNELRVQQGMEKVTYEDIEDETPNPRTEKTT